MRTINALILQNNFMGVQDWSSTSDIVRVIIFFGSESKLQLKIYFIKLASKIKIL